MDDPELRVIRATGNSMFPMIPSGTVLVFRKGSAGRRGDVVLAAINGKWVAHRVVGLREDVVILRGDWNRHQDPAISADAVYGRCILMQRKGQLVATDSRAMRLLGRLVSRGLSTLISCGSRAGILRPSGR